MIRKSMIKWQERVLNSKSCIQFEVVSWNFKVSAWPETIESVFISSFFYVMRRFTHPDCKLRIFIRILFDQYLYETRCITFTDIVTA